MKEKTISPLKGARLAAKLSMAKLGALAGTSAQQIERLEKPEGSKDGRKLTREWAERLAPHLNTTPERLIFGEKVVPLVGETGAGGAISFFQNQGNPPEMVEGYDGAPAGTVAIRLNSSLNSLFYGWLAYYDTISPEVTPNLIGKICVVWLECGEAIIRQVTLGQKAGTYTLLSNIEPPIYDAEISQIAKISTIRQPSD